ncbi:MAG TPA: NUDIX domain-containing protein [Firmicutes bacterium]|nr:NUDIX domain-containing protein [Bacillota bacterium]
MQIIVNCLLLYQGMALFLCKPRRNWSVCPGGKIELAEHVQEAVIREYKEETAITLIDPQLKAISFNIYKKDTKVVKQILMFTFLATKYQGENWDSCHEGKLSWIPKDKILQQDMAAGDRIILEHLLNHQSILSATFIYDEKEQLISHRFSVMNT